MNKKQAGERKRTVTVTVGPLTWKFVGLVAERMSTGAYMVPIGPTDVVGACLTSGLAKFEKDLGIPQPDGMRSHFD